LQEITEIYKFLPFPDLLKEKSNEICIILSLFKLITMHEQTIIPFQRSLMVYYLLPFLSLDSKIKENEKIKLSTLNVFISLAKSDKPEIIQFFADKKIVLTILKVLENGSPISTLVANCIMKIILSKEKLLDFICEKKKTLDTVNFFLVFFINFFNNYFTNFFYQFFFNK
jgi:hypothetical protein